MERFYQGKAGEVWEYVQPGYDAPARVVVLVLDEGYFGMTQQRQMSSLALDVQTFSARAGETYSWGVNVNNGWKRIA